MGVSHEVVSEVKSSAVSHLFGSLVLYPCDGLYLRGSSVKVNGGGQ